MESIHSGSVGKNGNGCRLKMRISPPDGNPMTFYPTVSVLPGQRLRWLGHFWIPGLFDGEHDFRIEQTSPGRSCFRQSEQFRGILVKLFPNAMYEKTQRGFEAMNRALKERVEELMCEKEVISCISLSEHESFEGVSCTGASMKPVVLQTQSFSKASPLPPH